MTSEIIKWDFKVFEGNEKEPIAIDKKIIIRHVEGRNLWEEEGGEKC